MHLSKFLLAGALAASPTLAQSCLFSNTTPIGTNLNLTDDSTRIIALPFTFPFNGVNYNIITVCSNGFVSLGINSNTDFSDSEAEFLAQNPRVAPCWDDLNPGVAAAGNGVFYNETPVQASVIWKNVPLFSNNAVLMNFEVSFFITGEIDLYWDPSCGIPASTSITGITAGGGAAANALDLSTFPASANPIIANSTGYELFPAGVQDLIGTTMSLLPISPTDYLVINQPLANCPPNTPPTLPTYGNASAVSYGTGCSGASTGNWYEEFPASTIDLSNTSYRFVASGGNNFTVVPGSGFDTSYTAADVLTQGDDTQVTCPLTMMGSFPFMGSNLTSVAVCSNGFIWMTPNTSNDYTPTALEFASQSARLAPCWADWNFTVGGTFYWTKTPTFCMATWLNVAAYGTTGTQNSFQCKLFANGDIQFSYLSVQNNSTTGGVALVGLSGGNSGPLAPADVSAMNPSTMNLTSSGSTTLTHSATLPQIGTSYTMTTSGAPTGAIFGATLIGFQQVNVPLGPIGAPGCSQYVNSLANVLAVLGGNTTWNTSIAVPLDLSFVGVILASQGVAYRPGINALGVTTSNGMLCTLGL